MSLLAIFVFAFLAQQPRPASIEGTVVQMGTPQPIAKAVVELSGGNGRESSVMVTGSGGRFEFRNLAAGQYQLKVSRNGYSGRSRGLSVDAGQSVQDIRLSLVPLGAISGRVFDNTGEPLANVTVRALKYSYANGQRTLTLVTTDKTDDRGEYRLFWLSPGEYYVSAIPEGGPENNLIVMFAGAGGVQHAGADGELVRPGRSEIEKLGEAYVPVYYPGTPDLQAAVPVRVGPGADLGGVHFNLVRVAPRKVRGIVVDGTTGLPATSASVTLVPRYVSITGGMPARTTSNGTFEVQRVFPGSYFLVATARLKSGNGIIIMGGRTALDVGNADLDRAVVVMSQSVDIAGQITTEGLNESGADHHPIVTLKSELRALPGAFSDVYAQFNGNRRFVINNVIEGDYQLQLTDLSKDTYIKSIRFGVAAAVNGGLRIDSRSTDHIEIVLSANAGALDGTVIDKNRQPVANSPVALVPDAARRQRADSYRNTTTDEFGRFHLQGIPPGDYLLFAWEDIEDGLWREPEFIRRNEVSGRPIRISESSRENVDLTAIPFAF